MRTAKKYVILILTMVTIVQRNDAILRGRAKPVPVSDISSKKIKKILSDMKSALHAENDGVGIAAPQIGVPLRLFVVNGVILRTQKRKGENQEDIEVVPPDLVFINPEITKLSRDRKKMEEGCLSVRPLFGMVERSSKATIRAYDENGKPFVRGASGLLAQIFQHEVDHLNGILFIDHATDLREIPYDAQEQ